MKFLTHTKGRIEPKMFSFRREKLLKKRNLLVKVSTHPKDRKDQETFSSRREKWLKRINLTLTPLKFRASNRLKRSKLCYHKIRSLTIFVLKQDRWEVNKIKRSKQRNKNKKEILKRLNPHKLCQLKSYKCQRRDQQASNLILK